MNRKGSWRHIGDDECIQTPCGHRSSKCDHSGPQMEQQSELEMTRFGAVCCQADEKTLAGS